MFFGYMVNTWAAATMIAVVAGVVGFFAVLRSQSFAAHAIPHGSFGGAAGAVLLGVNNIFGLALFAIGGALGISWMARRGQRDVVTALSLVLMLGLGSLFLSFGHEYSDEVFSLLFGDVLGVSSGDLLALAGLGLTTLAATAALWRPLLLASVIPEVAEARGVPTRRVETAFLLVVALATTMTVPVVGVLLMFSLMIGPAATARSLTDDPRLAVMASCAIALVIAWASVALSYQTNWPIGFFVGIGGVLFYAGGQLWSRLR